MGQASPSAPALAISLERSDSQWPVSRALEGLGFDVVRATSANEIVASSPALVLDARVFVAVERDDESALEGLRILCAVVHRPAIAIGVKSPLNLTTALWSDVATLGADWSPAQLAAVLDAQGVAPLHWPDAGRFDGRLVQIEFLLDVMHSLRLMHDLNLESAWILMIVAEATLRPASSPRNEAWAYTRDRMPSPSGWISRRMVADKTGMARESVRRRIARLLRDGYLVAGPNGAVQLSARYVDDARMLAVLRDIDRFAVRYTQRSGAL